MNITRENIDALNAIIKVKIDKADYEEKLNNVLKDYKKKANIPGFRPGHVPFGMINRMYRLPVLIEEVNKLVLESMDKYIKDEGLNLLGEPIPSEKEQNKIDFQSQEDFEFAFDLGLSPEFEIDLSVADKIKFYDIQVDEVTIKNYVKNYARRYGTYKTGDVVEEDSMLKGDLLQMDDDGNELPDGINVEDSTLYVGAIKDDDTKKSLTGLKNGDSAAINLKKLFQMIMN